MELIGIVTAAGTADSEVTIYRNSACGSGCGGSCAGCIKAQPVAVRADNNGWRVREGQQVLLRGPERRMHGLSALLYLPPPFTGIAGALLAEQLFGPEGPTVLFALAGFVLGFLPAFAANRRLQQEGGIALLIEQVLAEGAQGRDSALEK
ncbi:MAG: SoxR reducing system RseC family protein [Clostridiales bacterium]|nr:SoxR reducing system RseC family protein [Clostridiales bacterium]